MSLGVQILEALAEKRKPMTSQELADVIGDTSARSVSMACRRLVAWHMLKRQDRGHLCTIWSLPA